MVAHSFARIFYRNAVNLGFPVLECPGVEEIFENGDPVRVNPATGEVENARTGKKLKGRPISGLEEEIAGAGGLLKYLAKK